LERLVALRAATATVFDGGIRGGGYGFFTVTYPMAGETVTAAIAPAVGGFPFCHRRMAVDRFVLRIEARVRSDILGGNDRPAISAPGSVAHERRGHWRACT
jgi:hypothetical protein